MRPVFLFLIACAGFLNGNAQVDARLFRYPDVSATQISFVYGGDIWLVAKDGGVARRITSHTGQELFAKFSPDGKWIAVTANQDGVVQLFRTPASGGAMHQLTAGFERMLVIAPSSTTQTRAGRVSQRLLERAGHMVLPDHLGERLGAVAAVEEIGRAHV